MKKDSEGNKTGGPEPMKRRSFINWLLGSSFALWAGSAVYPLSKFLFPPEGPASKESSVLVCTVDELSKENGKLFRIGNKPGILVKTASGEVKAYIAICTHLDCTVQYKKDDNIIWCACHNGRYNLSGANISGPPPRPLTPLVVAIKGDEIHVSLAT